MSSKRVRVAVIAGGRSSEHEISVASARSVLGGLDPDRYDVQTIEIDRDGRWQLDSGEVRRELERPVAETLPVPTESPPETLGHVDVVLPILHGPFGEDGTVQGLLELAGVPYVGAGVTASALCMDKDLFKSVCRDKGIPMTRSLTLRDGDEPSNPFGYPVFVKPARLGSSVGITKVRSEEELAEAVALARRHDDKVLVEEFVDGVEVEVGVLGNRSPIASIPGEIEAHGFGGVDWYDYSAKYDEGGMDLIIPPRISEEHIERVQQVSVDAFIAADCEGMARADCFVTAKGEVLVNELNTIPGFTATSVYAKLFEASGIPYPELLDRLIELALERHERRSRLQF
ncbi:MAG TPA: D-alanine--D-alanine ligase family protein [Gaiellaceae bacterium]|nr:D-alanine--D-alanine ligase family protein [Gaiellaceae bacterium]